MADDHLVVREGVRQLLDLEPDLTVVATVPTATELLDALSRTEIDAVVTDIRMPPGHGTEGIDAAHEVRHRHPRVGVVVLSAHAEEAYSLDLFRHGTAGLAYLLKDRLGDRGELARAVRTTASGGSVIDPLVVEAMLWRGRCSSPLGQLTDRERDVLEQMAAGRSNPAVAQALHLSVSAVEKHITAFFTKLGLAEEASTHRRVAAVLAFLGAD